MHDWALPKVRAAVHQKRPQNRAVTAALVGAVTADRKIGRVRERGQQIQKVLRARALHFGPKAAGESTPVLLRGSREASFEEWLARCLLRQPRVIEIARRILGFWDSTGRTADGAHP